VNTLSVWIVYLQLWLGGSLLLLGGCGTAPLPTHLPLLEPRETTLNTPAEPLANFEGQAATDEAEYQLGSGDHLTIEVWGYGDLSGKHVVGPDGRITLPLVGSFSIADYSRTAAADLIADALGRYYLDLSVTVRVDKYASNRILVLGRVAKPGEIVFGMTSPTLLEAIALAGGFAEAEGLVGASSLPYTRCAVFRGRDQIVWIELAPLLTGKDLSLNLRLQRNDVVYIPDVEERLVYVLGEVKRPGAFRLTPNMSFLELLAKAGGPTEGAATGRINLIRPTEDLNQKLALGDLLDPEPQINLALQEGDVIYVPTNAITRINYAMQFINPFSTMLDIYADIESIRADRQQRRIDSERDRLEDERSTLEDALEENAGFE